MFGTHEFETFLLASFLLWVTPGPDTMYIVARSVTQGRRAGVISGLGIGAGTILHTLLATFGLSVVLATSAWAFAAVKLAGAAYLIYLGVQSLRRPVKSVEPSHVEPMSGGQIFRQGFVTNALNPKVAVFFLAFLPQFVDASAGLGPIPFLFLGMSFVIGGTAWCLLVAVCAASVSASIRDNPKTVGWLERAGGCIYIVLGANLLRQESSAV